MKTKTLNNIIALTGAHLLVWLVIFGLHLLPVHNTPRHGSGHISAVRTTSPETRPSNPVTRQDTDITNRTKTSP